MKTIVLIPCLLGAMAASTSAQPYHLDQFAVSGGGGVSTGGGYTLTGSIGRMHPRPLIGGGYVLTVGAWGVVGVVQNPEAPLLSAQRTSLNTVMVSWPGPEAGWRLQTTTSLSTVPVVWTDVAPPYSTGQSGFYIVTPSASGIQFYRLYRP